MGPAGTSIVARKANATTGPAQALLTRTQKWSWLKAWGMKLARHRGMRRAIVAVARRMAIVMHRMWRDGTEFRWTSATPATA